MKPSRRQLLQLTLGATQLALLERFGIADARADLAADAPTKLVTLYIPGGVRFWNQWWPMDDASVATGVLPKGGYDGEPTFFNASDLITLGPANGAYAPLRMAKSWDATDPAIRDWNKGISPLGYGWLNWKLHENTAVLHGIDQGTNAHQSGYIAAMCGVAGADYRAPALQSVVANYLHRRFADSRPLPSVAIDARGMPVARGLPPTAAPVHVPNTQSIRAALSDDPAANWWWKGLNTRGANGQTDLEARAIRRARAYQGRSTKATDDFLEQLAGGLESVSRVLSRNVAGLLEKTPGSVSLVDVPYLKNFNGDGNFGYHFGLANFYMKDLEVPLDMTLRLLKSDLCSTVHTYLAPYFDTHNGSYGHDFGYAHVRASMDCIARFVGQLKDLPAPGKPGKTMLDDTLVVVFSEFARSWATGGTQSMPAGMWNRPDDHHPFTSVTYIGGGVAGNRQIGNYVLPEGRGVDVDLIEEDGTSARRNPRAADATTTACRIMGMGFTDFFLPGGYGEVVGIRQT